MSVNTLGTKDYSLVDLANPIQTNNTSEVKSPDLIQPLQHEILTSNTTLIYLTMFIVAMTAFFKTVNNK